jgi:Zn-finger nucleic acid-binding protein
MPETETRQSLQCPNCGAPVAADSIRCSYCRSVLTTLACPACFAAVFKGVRFCPACGAAVERQKPISGKKLSCPRCEARLSAAEIGGTPVHACDRCGGIWLDSETFQLLCQDREKQEQILGFAGPDLRLDLQPAEPTARMYIPCPECGGLMQRKNFAGCSGVIVDWCKPHGFWFDRQELTEIVLFIKAGGLQKARQQEIDRLQSEQRRLRDLQDEQGKDQLRPLRPFSLSTMDDEASLLDVILAIGKKLL